MLTARFHLFLGKGDLVGCDISQHLAACSNGQGGSNQHGTSGSQDVIVKSSSDVKVMYRHLAATIHNYDFMHCTTARLELFKNERN